MKEQVISVEIVYDQVINGADRYSVELNELLENQAVILGTFNGVYSDVFWITGAMYDCNFNDFELIYHNACICKDLMRGAKIGPNVVTYDISMLPLYYNE